MSGSVEFVSHQVAPQAEPAGPPPTSDEVVAEPAPRRPRLWLRSLTSRLVAGVVALVVVLVGMVGAATFFSLRSFLYQRLDQQLSTIASSNAARLTPCVRFNELSCPIGGPPEYRSPLDEWVGVLDSTGASIGNVEDGNGLKALKLSSGQSRAVVADPGAYRTLTTQDGTELRVTAHALSSPNGGEVIVVSGLSTSDARKTLDRLVAIEVVIGGAAVAVALGATWWGVRRSLRNLYRVTGTAQEVAADLSPDGAGLDRRVPVVEQGTEVGQLAESMNTLLAAVETQFAARLESEQRMRQFLADASHELRTPLTSIRGYAELARMQRDAGDTQHDNLDRIESEGTRMSRLVNDLLLLARGDADEAAQAAPRELVEVHGLLDEAVSGSRAAYPERAVELDVRSLPPVLGDRDQLLRVVRNLITNAAVHTDASRPIHVRGFTDAGGAVIVIADEGPGLPPEQAAHVFERFWRADKARTRVRGGSGLGLSIVAAIVHSHGGVVQFYSTVESGSTVTVWLPAASQ